MNIFIAIILLIFILAMTTFIVTRVKRGNAESIISQLVDTPDFDIFLKYMRDSTDVPQEIIDGFLEQVGNKTDDELLEYVVSNSPPFVEKMCCDSDAILGRTKSLLRILGRPQGLRSYLDIGGTTTERLRVVSKLLKIPYRNCFAVNIAEDDISSLHYGDMGNKIVIYNGYDIPVLGGNETYDLITIASVLHHVPPNVMKKLVPMIYKRCGRYLLLKENDLCNESSRLYFKWQHLLFWRSTEMLSYTRDDLTLEHIIGMFERVGFKHVRTAGMNLFTRSKYILFKK